MKEEILSKYDTNYDGKLDLEEVCLIFIAWIGINIFPTSPFEKALYSFPTQCVIQFVQRVDRDTAV